MIIYGYPNQLLSQNIFIFDRVYVLSSESLFNPDRGGLCNEHASALGIAAEPYPMNSTNGCPVQCCHVEVERKSRGESWHNIARPHGVNVEIPSGFTLANRLPVPGDYIITFLREVRKGSDLWLSNTLTRIGAVEIDRQKAQIHFSCSCIVSMSFDAFVVVE